MTAHLYEELAKLGRGRVVCVGDLMLDRFIYGQVDRISPEAPIPVLRIARETVALGGVGNVVRNCVALGGNVALVGVIGADAAGRELSAQLEGCAKAQASLVTDAARPTTTKIRYVADGQQLLRADSETSVPLPESIESELLKQAERALENASLLILSDYAKGVLTEKVLARLISLCRAAGKPVLIDPKGRDFTRYRGASFLTPNRKELAEATALPVRTPQEAETAARLLIESCELDGVVAKLGSDGVCLVLKDAPACHFQTAAREVYDVSGAGDTVMAAFALGLAGGIGLEDCAFLANLAGSIVVGKTGTASLTREDLAGALMRGRLANAGDKIMTLDAAARQAEVWRKQGLKVGFTNGVFDLLHPGHLSLLRQARAACDRLIVGMNSDASVKRLKGETRPVQGEDSRAAVLAALTDVDGVVLFAQDTPIEPIKAIRPDLLVKGADYTVETVVGSDLVQSWGGTVKLAQLVEGQSTTKTIAKLRA